MAEVVSHESAGFLIFEPVKTKNDVFRQYERTETSRALKKSRLHVSESKKKT